MYIIVHRNNGRLIHSWVKMWKKKGADGQRSVFSEDGSPSENNITAAKQHHIAATITAQITIWGSAKRQWSQVGKGQHTHTHNANVMRAKIAKAMGILERVSLTFIAYLSIDTNKCRRSVGSLYVVFTYVLVVAVCCCEYSRNSLVQARHHHHSRNTGARSSKTYFSSLFSWLAARW